MSASSEAAMRSRATRTAASDVAETSRSISTSYDGGLATAGDGVGIADGVGPGLVVASVGARLGAAGTLAVALGAGDGGGEGVPLGAGDGDTLGAGDDGGDAVALGAGERTGVALGVHEGDVVALALGEGDVAGTVGEGPGDRDAAGDGLGLTLGDGLCTGAGGEGIGLGLGDGSAARALPPASAVNAIDRAVAHASRDGLPFTT